MHKGDSGRRTDGGGLDHVADGESLDGLVLRGASRAVGATDRLDVAPAVLVAAAANQMLAMSLVGPEEVLAFGCARGVVLGRALLDHLCDLRRVGSAGMFYLLKLLECCEVSIVGGGGGVVGLQVTSVRCHSQFPPTAQRSTPAWQTRSPDLPSSTPPPEAFPSGNHADVRQPIWNPMFTPWFQSLGSSAVSPCPCD